MKQIGREKETHSAVSPVIGVILMVALTVILAAIIGTFILGLGSSVDENVRGAVTVDFDTMNDRVDVTYVGSDNADYLNITFSGDVNHEGVVRLNKSGDRVRLTDSGMTVTGDAKIYEAASHNGPGSDITVTAVGVSGDQATVLLDQSGEI